MIVAVLSTLLVLAACVIVCLVYLLVRGARRLLAFDELFEMLFDDVSTNVRYFEKLKATPLVSNTDEVQAAHKNMMIMGARLDEYAKRMEEQVGRPLLRKEVARPPRPVAR